MKKFLLISVSLAGGLFAQDTPYWVEPCNNPTATSCEKGDVELATWAFDAWQAASGGKIHFVRVKQSDQALLRLVWAEPSLGMYGETMPILVNGHRGAQIYVRISPEPAADHLLRDTIVYLTCLHESGHALGLRHTADFEDIMYSFQFGGDIPEYFGRYRRLLKTREDIRKHSGMSAADRERLMERLGSQ
jgi:hypothetical protein